MRRAARDDVVLTARGAQLHAADDAEWAKALRNKKGDLSESLWLVLMLGGLLLAEQYLSMKLSFNSALDVPTAA